MGVSSLSEMVAKSEALGPQIEYIDYEGGDSYKRVQYKEATFPTQYVKISTPQGQITAAVSSARTVKHFNFAGTLTKVEMFSSLNPWVLFGLAVVLIAGVAIDDWDSEEKMIWTFSAGLSYPDLTLFDEPTQIQLLEELPNGLVTLVTNPDIPNIT